MLTGRRFAGKRLPLTLALGVLVVAAIGAGCKGFFQDPTLNSIAIQPPSPQVEVGGTSLTLQAWGSYSDGSRSQITSGVAWTSSDATVAVFTDNCGNGIKTCASETSGSATLEGVGTGGTATITAAAQGLTGTATATAYLSITNFQLCQTTSSGTVIGSCSTTLTWDATGVGTSPATEYFIAQGTNTATGKTQDFTQEATWTITGSSTSGITCDNSLSPAVCTVAQATAAGSYGITVTYGTNNTATVAITVTE